MEKDFDNWNTLKKSINKKEIGDDFNFHAGDIWWTTMGLNIGKEMDGKHETFERPVLILKVINRHTMYVFPLTSKDHFVDKYHYKVEYEEGGSGVVVFSQMRVISSNRLLRKVGKINKRDLQIVIQLFNKILS